MAFDEIGQADTYDRKVEICSRAYKILTDVVGMNGQDIIFDPNIFAVATGIEEHNEYGKSFIEAARTIKEKKCQRYISVAELVIFHFHLEEMMLSGINAFNFSLSCC